MNKAKLEIFYSLAVLIIVPSLLALNTILLATSVRNDNDKELQSRAELANSVLALSLQDLVEDNQVQQTKNKLQNLEEIQNEVNNLAVITKNSDEYKVFSASEDDYKIFKTDELQYDIVFSRERPVAKNIEARTDNGQTTRAWNVASPIINEEEQVIGVVVSDYLTTDNDERFDATLSRSFYIMIGSAVGVIILLFNHFRFIGYADLLLKQKELNQTMSDFLSVATHELKAPMSIIKGYISNVVDGDFGEINEEAKKQLGVATAQTDRLNELVQDLLNVSRIEQGKIQLTIQPVEITNVINTIVDNYLKPASDKGIKIEYNPQNQVWVKADIGRVQEIFTNLIDNAVKYSKQGKVEITHKISDKYIESSVRDNGIGMTAEERSRLFQRFYRVKNENTTGISGTGLGLWIIKQYIEKMGGKISVDSLVGAGTEFRVLLVKSKSPEKPQRDNGK